MSEFHDPLSLDPQALAELPPVPQFALQQMNVFGDADSGLTDVVEILQNNPALTRAVV